MRAREYQTNGYQNAEPWMTSNIAKLKSNSARTVAGLGRRCLTTNGGRLLSKPTATRTIVS